ncbi:GGDEF domain-containing protein [Methylibium sp. Root1272]|uniref:GGDEF domain-containing protein n=1 Tax=Methylibium sp. Root1272 TaxID=1736441 RepID=UPI0006F2132D|nr:GGDEF domain-containing protein [Methylibium sp. Root1272]KQW65440.1 diguanylate cyclase [Methylibium sp. Root1272]
MTDLLGSVVSLTGYRDRDLLDAAAVTMLADWLRPLSLSLYRCVGEAGDTRLLLQACARDGPPAVAGDPPWTPLEALPSLDDWPPHRDALTGGEPLLALPTSRPGPRGRPVLLNVFPLWIGTERFGLVEVLAEKPLDAEQLRFVDAVLKIYRNQVGLLDYSERDTLTGLLNRKTFDEQFSKCLHECARSAPLFLPPPTDDQSPERRARESLSYWIGVVDVDHFKRVNDRFGHLIGDEVLLLMARILRGAFRHGDRLYRFGGEEFVIVLRADSRVHASLALERFRARMEIFRFPQVGSVTVSIGMTELRAGDTPSAAFSRADLAVYHAKQNGRNQLQCHDQLVERGALVEAGGKVGEIELF